MASIAPFGIEKGANYLGAVAGQINNGAVSAIRNWLNLNVIPLAKSKAPVKTGNLKSRIAIQVVMPNGDMTTFIVGWGQQAIYGKFHERGTATLQPLKFVANAIRESAGTLESFWVAEVVGGEIGRIRPF